MWKTKTELIIIISGEYSFNQAIQNLLIIIYEATDYDAKTTTVTMQYQS